MTEQESDIELRAKASVGTWLKDKYRLDRVLGIGGMAVVFAATHRNQAEFAVKMLHRELSLNQDVRTRFLREGYAANSVKHRGAVRVVDDDVSEDGAAFLVMELLQGAVIEALWEQSGRLLPAEAVLCIGYQLLDVLAAAHAKSVVHRDIKPANVFLTHEGVVKVLDFGIARLRDVALAGGKGTQTGLMMGTPAFMAPEQAMAKPAEIDAQTDVWAVGATLYTLVSGQLVHQGDNAQQLLIRAATSAARPLREVAPHVPAAVADVIDRALAFDKANRWSDAEAMRDAVNEACIATYGEPPSRKRLALLLGGAADSPDSTRPFRSIPASSVRPGAPSGPAVAVTGVPAVSGVPVPTESSPRSIAGSASGSNPRPSIYRLSTELTSSSASESRPAGRSSRSVRLLLGVGAFAFALAFAGGLLLHAYRPGALPRGLVPGPAAAPGLPVAAAPTGASPVGAPAASVATIPAPAAMAPGAAGAAGASAAIPVEPPSAAKPSDAKSSAAKPFDAKPVAASPSASPVPSASVAVPEAVPESGPHAKHRPHHEPAPKPAPTAVAVEPPKTEPPPAGPDCSVPYTVDADGNKKWKMECLGH